MRLVNRDALCARNLAANRRKRHDLCRVGCKQTHSFSLPPKRTHTRQLIDSMKM
jgi:hypothetical protein